MNEQYDTSNNGTLKEAPAPSNRATKPKIRLFKNTSKRKRIVIVVTIILLLSLIAGSVYTYSQRNSAYVARVDGVGITKDNFNKVVVQQQVFYQQANQQVQEQQIKQTVLDNLIQKQLIENYAAKNAIAISPEAIEQAYKQRLSAYPNEDAFLDKLNQLYGTSKEEFKETLRYDLLREAVQQSVNKPLPDWLAEQQNTASIDIYITL